MHAPSYYAATARDTAGFEHLNGEVDVDIAVIGGGFSGVNTALELAERGHKVALLEAKRIGWG
ncbi:MAG: FAD-dependent oxidoreductase, partial [Pseudomonadota bacterium]|nr:FAD-dependent oxidoreductase [Pseudomonadota bacterium]